MFLCDDKICSANEVPDLGKPTIKIIFISFLDFENLLNLKFSKHFLMLEKSFLSFEILYSKSDLLSMFPF